VLVACELVGALQSIASRNTDPVDALVVTVTQIHGGDAYNVIPGEVHLAGTVRSFREEVRDSVAPAMKRIADGICAAYGATAELRYVKLYPATVNSVEETEQAVAAAAAVVGADAIDRSPVPSMGAEDFAYMLCEKPGSYIWVGNGDVGGGCMLHNPGYDFNDEIIPIGVSYWAELVELALPAER
ncbi:MAG: M20/M25/M40 family metallo-hydrolase, partial [Alphaproteobacteria bacterium]